MSNLLPRASARSACTILVGSSCTAVRVGEGGQHLGDVPVLSLVCSVKLAAIWRVE
jgi:hypothetical protein